MNHLSWCNGNMMLVTHHAPREGEEGVGEHQRKWCSATRVDLRRGLAVRMKGTTLLTRFLDIEHCLEA
jgi:hypothetical protein